jgi:hypothetical protein
VVFEEKTMFGLLHVDEPRRGIHSGGPCPTIRPTRSPRRRGSGLTVRSAPNHLDQEET